MGALGAFLLAGCAVGAGLAGFLLQRSGLTAESLAALSSYAFACELYIFLFSSISSSISASLLYGLRSGALSATELESRFGGAAMVERRLSRMLSTGILQRSATSYSLTARGIGLMRAYRGCRGFFRRGTAGSL